MPILPIYAYDHPILRQQAHPVQDITDAIRRLAENMMTTMRNAEGIGLAANQVGESQAVAVVDISGVEEELLRSKFNVPPMVLVNPVILAYSDEVSDMEEGCLSLPSYRDTVTRPEKIQVRFYDLTMREHTLEAEGLLARVIQHEIDHLHGKYFFDYLSPVRRAMAHPKLRRIQLGQVTTEYPLFTAKQQRASRSAVRRSYHS
ncbi:MAG: peptide deformylase [Bacteroidota bacterium]|nr:peptide deformylase [Candidatus Kapabacteria bacterium]MDW8218942.1 peptide deformylase [Bacteroidota bacterium]